LPAGRAVRHSDDMGSDDVLELLARADAAEALPRLGGMARPNGVVIVSERHWAFASVDGAIGEGVLPRRRGAMARLPLVRGLVRLSTSLAPLLRGRGVARGRERMLLLAALVVPFGFVALPGRWSLVAGIAITFALIVALFRGRTLRLHGAEHRAIAAAEERRLVESWAGIARPSRFAARCGTNFAAIAVPVTVGLQAVWPFAPEIWTPAVVMVAALALSMEVWLVVQGRRALRPLLLPGLALQRLTTREPSLEDTRVALAAVASVLRRELEVNRC